MRVKFSALNTSNFFKIWFVTAECKQPNWQIFHLKYSKNKSHKEIIKKSRQNKNDVIMTNIPSPLLPRSIFETASINLVSVCSCVKNASFYFFTFSSIPCFIEVGITSRITIAGRGGGGGGSRWLEILLRKIHVIDIS